ncbi:hypothetical protein HME9304_01085 [Flagellimonas maritima]|uniref:NYN domain-containing protein n=1 Tax=Flagellimonas maritima TaxID=1383885 RepID=A0A2Z4LQG2_9FLAO|nr:NYN domain-containing protein [Allomuricauda aurantiaca]AWX44085.1 hypothetical protein HME9304_01085 [Allomuricauda aurantiaca]
MRTIFYIDGFNFYYGLKNKKRIDSTWAKYYWIDIVKLCEQFLGPDDTLIKVKYFTAPPLSLGKRIRQSALFKANDIINKDKFELIRGKYIMKPMMCNNCKQQFEKPEEKRTDVNISVQLLGDCALNKVDKVVLISADSDLVPPLEFIKENFPAKKIKIYFPPTSYSNDLRDISFRRKIVKLENNRNNFELAIMPTEVVKSDGSDTAIIPASWIYDDNSR